jgi:hypothetical protein
VPTFFLGLDLGQANDYTALTILEKLPAEQPQGRMYHGRLLERLPRGTPYPDVARHVKGLMATGQLAGIRHLIVDQTGVGRPVVDMLRSYGLSPLPVNITGGDKVTREGGVFGVPKRDLVSALQVLLQTGRLKFAEGLPEVKTLVSELLAFEVKITASAHDTYGVWREGKHDDLVLSVALAAWYAEQVGGGWVIGPAPGAWSA